MNHRIKSVIVDDETQSRIVLRSLLENFLHKIEIVGEAGNVEEAFELISLKKPELVFLDIQMPRGNGFTLLKKFEKVPFQVIFVTSFDKYAINAIKFSALDYLLKPIEVIDLKEAISKAVNSIEKERSSMVQIINLLHTLDSDPKDLKVAIHTRDCVKFISSENILYIESDGSYCNFTTTTNEHYVTSKYLKDYEDYFGENSNFIRIHKSCLLNVNQIKGYNKGEPCIIEMINGQMFEVSRRKKKEVLEKLKK
jgi:two-component system, LytTR family, response regulator